MANRVSYQVGYCNQQLSTGHICNKQFAWRVGSTRKICDECVVEVRRIKNRDAQCRFKAAAKEAKAQSAERPQFTVFPIRGLMDVPPEQWERMEFLK